MMNESQLAEIEERAKMASESMDDNTVALRYSEHAANNDVPLLLEALRASYNSGGGGGDLGVLLRNACKARIVRESQKLDDEGKRIAELCDDVKIHSLDVHAIRGEGSVVVTVRMLIGDQPVLT
jgi:hypothetical protein